MSNPYGFSGFNNRFNPVNNLTQKLATGLNGLISEGRVTSIVLDETDYDKFLQYGEWNGLGTIEYTSVNNPKTGLGVAKPLFPNIKNYPLINEIVYIISLPNTNIGTNSTSTSAYYINIIGLWNHPHHNAYPVNAINPSPEQQKDYEQVGEGSVRRVTDKSTEINLGDTFKERTNIHPLLPFEGDIIYEGRWGNGVRFGSTVKNKPNNWSETGTDGDPITIIRNGQGKQDEQGWIPVTENINNDDSSVYITSTQKIPIEASSTNYNSYTVQPTKPNQYSNKQIILNSGRLLFNSTMDEIMLSSKTSINLNAVNSLNIDTPTTIIQSNRVNLGSKDAVEPLLLGNSTYQVLTGLITALNTFFTAAAKATPTVEPGLTPIAPASNLILSELTTLKTSVEKIKSNTSFTI
jgi:hypothetical protein